MCYTRQMKERNHLDCKLVCCTHTLYKDHAKQLIIIQ